MRMKPWTIVGILAALAACTQTTPETTSLSPVARTHLQTMATEAKQVADLLRNSGAATPERLQLRLDWDEKVFDAHMKSAPDQSSQWIADREQAAREKQRDATSPATTAMVRFAVAEAAFLRAAVAKDQKPAKTARVDMASEAAHVILALSEMNPGHPQTIPWRTLRGKWMWRAANGAMDTALENMSPGKIADEWVGNSRSVLNSAPATESPFVEQFNVARMDSLKASTRSDDKAVEAAGRTMETTAQTGLDLMDRQAATFFAVPENVMAYLDWSHKRMEADWLDHKAIDAKRKALEAHAARVQGLKTKATDELSRHMLAYATADVEFLRATLK